MGSSCLLLMIIVRPTEDQLQSQYHLCPFQAIQDEHLLKLSSFEANL